MSSHIKPAILRIFSKRHGLQVSKEGSQFLEDMVSELSLDASRDGLLDSLDFIAKAYIQHQHHASNVMGIVSKDGLEAVIQEIKKTALVSQTSGHESQAKAAGEYLHVVDAFEVPKWIYKYSDKSFIRSSEQLHLLAPAVAKTHVFRDRYNLIHQRIMRNEAFSSAGFASATNTDFCQIMPIKNLNGRQAGRYLLFGMLTYMKDGLYLEDPDASIALDFAKNMQQGPGLFTPNCFVLAHGEYTDEKRFVVQVLGMPPPESRTKSLAAYGNDVDFFGGPQNINDTETLIGIEQQMNEAFFVILSDVWLDQPKVIMKLKELFKGFANSTIPLAFVLIGNFCSKPYIYDSDDCTKYKEGFDRLMEALSDTPRLKTDSQFIFVPGPFDPWCGNIFPRPKIPKSFYASLTAGLDKATFTSNPARLKYCSQEILIFRDDLQNTMRRNCIVPPVERDNLTIEDQLVSTVLDQSHLMPVPFQIRPVFWAHAHALSIYPQPHLLILADKCDSYSIKYEGARVINPGSFPNSNFKFMVYQPATGECQASEVPSAE